jgi:F-type H+-transporting ATPase subunit gamma
MAVQSLRQIKGRIRSAENTKKVTRAMEMISVAKLRQTQNLVGGSAVYVEKIEYLLKRLLGRLGSMRHPLISASQATGKAAVCFITSDTGLCGAYNLNVLRMTDEFVSKRNRDHVVLVPIGRKGAVYFRKKGSDVSRAYIGFNGRYNNERRDEILKFCLDLYTSKTVDEVYFIYTKMEVAARGRVVTEKFLNLEYEAGREEEYDLEPDLPSILDELIPVYLGNKMRVILLNAFIAEHNARSLAMGEATKNAIELLQALIMQRNKMRQASITSEMIEIISSAEALRG